MLPAREQRQPDLPRDAIRLTGRGDFMPTQIYGVTPRPANLIGAVDINGDPLALAVGTTYSARFQAGQVQALLKIREAPDGTTLTASSQALLVRRFEDVVIVPASGESVFAWSEAPDSFLVINAVA